MGKDTNSPLSNSCDILFGTLVQHNRYSGNRLQPYATLSNTSMSLAPRSIASIVSAAFSALTSRVTSTLTACVLLTAGSANATIVFSETFDGPTLDPAKWVVSALRGDPNSPFYGTNHPATLSFASGRLAVAVPGGANGSQGIPDGSRLQPNVVVAGDFEITLRADEALRQAIGGYSDNSGFSLVAGDVSITIAGNYSAGTPAHRVVGYNGAANCINNQTLSTTSLYAAEFKISRLASAITLAYRLNGGSWSTVSCGTYAASFTPWIDVYSGDGGGTAQNGRFTASMDDFSVATTTQQASPIITNPAVGVFTGGINLTAKIDSASVSGVVITVARPPGTFSGSGVLRLCRGEGNACETVVDAPYTSGAASVTFPAFTPRLRRQDFYFVQRYDAVTIGGLDPNMRSAQMIVIADNAEEGRVNAVETGRGLAGRICGLASDGQLRCWSSASPTTPAVYPGFPASLSKISFGDGEACVLASGAVWCAGSNDVGQLGDGSTTARAAPVNVVGLPAVITDIATGRNTSCALSAGSAWCWGFNFYGEATGGVSPNSPISVLSATLVPSLGTDNVKIVFGDFYGCALKASGAVLCWGLNKDGSLGNGVGLNTNTIYPATAVAGIVATTLASHPEAKHVCVTKADYSVWCWGENGYAQLGRGSASATQWQPARATAFTQSAKSMTFARYATCIITLGDAVACVGQNDGGRLGSGDAIDPNLGTGYSSFASTATILQGVSGDLTSAFASGGICVSLKDGSVRCSGSGYKGDGSNNSSYNPVKGVGFGPVETVLPAPVMGSFSRTLDTLTFAYRDGLTSFASAITDHRWACKSISAASVPVGGNIRANEAAGTNHTVSAKIEQAGEWVCQVMYRTENGYSSWSAWQQITARPTAVPTMVSAVYDGNFGTLVFNDNLLPTQGPIIDLSAYCSVSLNASSSNTPGCQGGDTYCTSFQPVSEPAGARHTIRLPLPPASAGVSSVNCRARYSTYDGPSENATVNVLLTATPTPPPTLNSGRIVGNTGFLSFSDNLPASAGTVSTAAWSCLRTRDNANYSGAVAVNRPSGSTHTISFPLNSTDFQQNPDSYSCTVRIATIGLLGPSSTAYSIGPNSPPVISAFSFSTTNGVISGSFNITDPDGDLVKNLMVYFGTSARGTDCTSGVLGSWDVPRAGGTINFTASATNVGCAALTSSATTIYGFVRGSDANGRDATIVDAQAANTLPAPVPVTSATTYSFVFDAVPTTLPVRQPAQDITIRVVDQLGVTATQFNGPTRITLSVSGVTSDFDDPNQPAVQQSGHRTVWLKNGVGRIRAFRVNEPSVVSIVAVAKADSGFNLQPAVATAGYNGLKAALAFNTQSYITGPSSQISVGAAPFSSTVSLTMPIGGTLYNSLRADFISGVVAAYLRDKQGVLRGPAGVSANGLTLGFGSNRGAFDLVFKRLGGVISTHSTYTVNVNAATVAINNLLTTHLPSDRSVTRRRVLLLHGIFGSTLNTSSTKCIIAGAGNYRAVAPEMPDQHCARVPSVTGAFPIASCQDLRFACFDASGPLGTAMLWGRLEDGLVAAGYDVVQVAYDWRVKPGSVAMDYLAPAVKQAFDETQLPVDIIAHSMGGIVALNFLRDSPYRSYVDRLVLLGSPLAGSINAYGLMEVADPLGVEGATKVGDSFYAAAAEKLWRWKQPSSNLFTTSDMSGSNVYTSAASQTVRQRVFAEAAPAGFYLYPDQSFLRFTGASSLSSHRPSEQVDTGRIFRGADWADAPNRFGFASLTPYAECSNTLAARSSGISKTRVSALYSNDQSTKAVVNFANGNDLNVLGGLQVPQRFTTAFVRWTNDPSGGDGTVPLRGQLDRFAHLLGLSGSASVAACKDVNPYGLHAKLTNNPNAITWAVGRLPYPGVTVAATPFDAPKAQQAVAAPTLSIRANTSNEVTATVPGMNTFGSSRFLTNPASATGSAGLAGAAYADTATTTVEITNVPVGQSVITLSRQGAETVTLDRVKVLHTDATSTTSEYEISVLVRGTQSTSISITPASVSSQLAVTTQGPDPITNLRATPTSVGTTLSWSAPVAGIAVAGYRVFASKPHEETWSLVGFVAAGTTSYTVPFPAASQVQQEIAFVVVSADAQDRYSEVLDFASNRVRNDVESSFGSGRGNPGTLVLSPIVPMPNNVPISASVTGGEASVNGGAWQASGLLMPPFANVQVRGLASATASQWITVSLNGPTSASTFSILAAPPNFCRRPTRPVGESGAFIRYLNGIAGMPLMQGLYPAAEVSTTAANALSTHYGDNLDAYDFNGDGFTSIDVDSLLYARYALGFRGAGLVAGIAVGTARSTAQIETALAACQ